MPQIVVKEAASLDLHLANGFTFMVVVTLDTS